MVQLDPAARHPRMVLAPHVERRVVGHRVAGLGHAAVAREHLPGEGSAPAPASGSRPGRGPRAAGPRGASARPRARPSRADRADRRRAPGAHGVDTAWTMSRAASPAAAICFGWESWSTKRSGSVIGRNFQPAVQQPPPRQMRHHRRAEPARGPLLDRHHHLVRARQPLQQRPRRTVWRTARQPPSAGSPRAASSSAARNASARRVPSDTIATVPPLAQQPRAADLQHLARRDRHAYALAAAGSAPHSAGRRSRRPWPPCARAPPRRTAPSARSPAGTRDRPGRSCRRAVAPSAPTRPARSIANRTARPRIATSCTTWS